MILRTWALALVAVVFVGIGETGAVNIPNSISYQGRLTDAGGNPINGTVTITFRIYSVPTGGIALWSSGPQSVVVASGQFSVDLGASPMPAVDPSVFTDSTTWLGTAVAADPEMIPRTKLNSVPYAFTAYQTATSPGIAHEFSDLSPFGMTIAPGTTHVVDSVKMIPPADGFVVVEAHMDFGMNSVSSNYTGAWFSLSNNSSWDWDNVARTERAQGDVSTFVYLNSSLTKIEAVTGNTTYTCYLIGNAIGNPGSYFNLYRTHLTVMYFPTNYGTVISTIAPAPQGNPARITRESAPTISEKRAIPAPVTRGQQ
jgi:hypothetical protein